MDNKETFLADTWAKYRDEVVPDDAGETQLHETKIAFYAGCAAMFGAMDTELYSGPEEFELFMKVVSKELEAFVDDIEIEHEAIVAKQQKRTN